MRPTPRVPRRHSRRLESPKARRRKSRLDRSVRHRAVSLAIHRPAPRLLRRSLIRMPETVEPVARSSTNHRVRDFGDNPMTRRRKCAPRKAPFPKGLRRPQATAASPLRTRPLHRIQVPRWRAFSSGSIGKRPLGTAQFRRARRPFPGRKDVSAARTGRPSGQIGTQVLLTPPTLSRSIRITGLHLYCKTKCNKATRFLCINHSELAKCFTIFPQTYSQDAVLTYSLNPSLRHPVTPPVRRQFGDSAWARRRRTGRVVLGRNESRAVDPVRSSQARW